MTICPSSQRKAIWSKVLRGLEAAYTMVMRTKYVDVSSFCDMKAATPQ
jgi:hypothetical protein